MLTDVDLLKPLEIHEQIMRKTARLQLLRISMSWPYLLGRRNIWLCVSSLIWSWLTV